MDNYSTRFQELIPNVRHFLASLLSVRLRLCAFLPLCTWFHLGPVTGMVLKLRFLSISGALRAACDSSAGSKGLCSVRDRVASSSCQVFSVAAEFYNLLGTKTLAACIRRAVTAATFLQPSIAAFYHKGTSLGPSRLAQWQPMAANFLFCAFGLDHFASR